jgi:hypothetical protein
MPKNPRHLCQSAEHYTPVHFVEAARFVFGGAIDTDPASSAKANETVKARLYYTAQDNGLTQPWYGNVWVNPPGDERGSLVPMFWERFCEHIRDGKGAGIWAGYSLEQLQTLQGLTFWDGAPCYHPSDGHWMICDHRIQWRGPGGKGTNPTHGNFFTLLGGTDSMAARFHAKFGQWGVTMPSRSALISWLQQTKAKPAVWKQWGLIR